MSVSIYGWIPLKELQDEYEVVFINEGYWINAEDGGTLALSTKISDTELYVDEVTAYMQDPNKNKRYEIMDSLYKKYGMMTEDEFYDECMKNCPPEPVNIDPTEYFAGDDMNDDFLDKDFIL